MDVSESILANLDAGNPCWHDGLLGPRRYLRALLRRQPEEPGLAIFIPVGEREIMNHLVAIGLMKKKTPPRLAEGSKDEKEASAYFGVTEANILFSPRFTSRRILF